MAKFLIGALGAFIFALVTALILILGVGMDTGIAYYAIVGISAFIGLTLFERLYAKRKR
ncbi:MAG: hypothetical protein FWE12_07615 [Oscillospiraceae bacterium]|nr:hypothetical protein [Oscillospiraceae bacterium]